MLKVVENNDIENFDGTFVLWHVAYE